MSQKIRCAIYDRVSTELQVQTGLSLDTQKELLTEYALSNGCDIVDYYIDEGLTARKKLQNRKDFMRLLNDIRRDKIDLVLVTKLDRWFRNVRDYHNTQAVLEEHHCNWKTVLEDYDTSTADGQLKINIMLAVAQNESDRTSERIKVVFEHKKRKGEHLTGRAPYGYIAVNKFLQKNPAVSSIVDSIFTKYFCCLSKRETISCILETYRTCNQAPSAYQINRILGSEVYAGIRFGQPGYCDPYITMEQYELLQSVSSSKTYPATNEPYVFSQLMNCPHCHSVMTGFVKRQKLSDGTVAEYKRYRCSGKYTQHPRGACITESVAEDYMLKHLCPELRHTVYRIKKKPQKVPVKGHTPKLQAEMERLNLLFQKGRISEPYYDLQYMQLDRKLKAEQAHDKVLDSVSPDLNSEHLQGGWATLYRALDPEHRRTFWKRIIKEIYIDEKTHKLSGFSFLPRGAGTDAILLNSNQVQPHLKNKVTDM